MNPTNKDFILGSKKEHFVIEDDVITGINQDLLKQLKRYTYSGPLDISFPGCEEIKSINDQSFKTTCLKNISSINLSRMSQLNYIHKQAFQNVGSANKCFRYINLSCPQLETIDKQAFENVGLNSNYVNIIFGQSQLTTIEFAAFRNVGDSSVEQDSPTQQLPTKQQLPKQGLVLDLSRTLITSIGAQAFMNYNRYTKAKLAHIILPNTQFDNFQKCTFKYAFSNCDKVILKLTTKNTRFIDEECFARVKIHLDLTDSDDSLMEIQCKAIDAEYLNDNSAKIIIPKDNTRLYQVIGYPILQFLCLQENGQLEDQEEPYNKDICVSKKDYTKEQLQAEVSQIKEELKQNTEVIEKEIEQYLQKVKDIQQLNQSVEAKKQVLQMQQEFILEQEQRIKLLMTSLGYLDNKELIKRLQ